MAHDAAKQWPKRLEAATAGLLVKASLVVLERRPRDRLRGA